MLRLLLIALLALVPIGWAAPSFAQSDVPIVVSSCGTPIYTLTASQNANPTMDTTGKLCTAASSTLAGSTSNASSGVATSSTNVPTVSYNYGFNGATWDQLQVDGSKNLKVVDSGTVATTSTIITSAPTITITAGTYAAGQVIGGIVSFTGLPSTGIVTNVNCTFDSGTVVAPGLDFYLFNASPTGGGTTDNAGFALTSTDTAKMIGDALHLSDCTSLGGALAQCGMQFFTQSYTVSATTIFIVPVMRMSSVTFSGTTNMKCKLQVMQ